VHGPISELSLEVFYRVAGLLATSRPIMWLQKSSTEIPVLDFIDREAPAGVEQHNVGTKTIHMGLDIDFPSLLESTVKELDDREFARGQQCAELKERPSLRRNDALRKRDSHRQ
jgi:hypothetical protein